MNVIKKVGGWLKPAEKKSEDGRDQWPSRTAFLLASVGGAVVSFAHSIAVSLIWWEM